MVQFVAKMKDSVLFPPVSVSQSFSSSVLKSFSVDCKRMSVEIFERTMPSAGHWRPSHRTGTDSLDWTTSTITDRFAGRTPGEMVVLTAQDCWFKRVWVQDFLQDLFPFSELWLVYQRTTEDLRYVQSSWFQLITQFLRCSPRRAFVTSRCDCVHSCIVQQVQDAYSAVLLSEQLCRLSINKLWFFYCFSLHSHYITIKI